LPFCSNCGKELKGALKFCSSCGYRIEEDEYKAIMKSLKSTKKEEENYSDIKKPPEVPVKERPRSEPKDLGKQPGIRVPPGAKVKEKIPKSTTCLICNVKSDTICYFCDHAICPTHSIGMQIFADNSKFGNVIQSCTKCAQRKKGRQPTNEEAQGIGFFFNIKPYHEWKILKE